MREENRFWDCDYDEQDEEPEHDYSKEVSEHGVLVSTCKKCGLIRRAHASYSVYMRGLITIGTTEPECLEE